MLKHQCECGQVTVSVTSDTCVSPSGRLSLSEGSNDTFFIEVSSEALIIDTPPDGINSFVINRTLRQFVCSQCADALYIQTPSNTYLLTATMRSHTVSHSGCSAHHCSV